MIDKLRDEIIESEKTRTDLLKWKLILVAAIGAAALGVGSGTLPMRTSVVLLALIPLVCLYVDAVCFHNEIRIMTIARFLRMRPPHSIERAYEEFCKAHRSQFSLEGFALLVVTVGLSAAVLATGCSDWLQDLIGRPADSQSGGSASGLDLMRAILASSGGIGIVAGVSFYGFYRYRTRKLDE